MEQTLQGKVVPETPAERKVMGVLQIRRPRDVRFWIAVAVMLVAAAAFAVIAQSVATTAPIMKQDLQVSVWLHTHNNPVFGAFLFAITQVHSPAGVGVMAIILGYFIWRHGDRYWVASLALALLGGMLLNTALKFAFNRDRPTWDDPLLTLHSQSFPSGHAAGATLFYGFVAAYMVWRMKGKWAALVVSGCILMVAVVGFSRIYLGVHYLSDVLAAMSISTAWLVLSLVTVRAIAKRRGASASH
jgi:undecaprenyl-diphosphatase